ncbi:MAG: tRNA epoxyqueuosine(34) reductase QueG [Pseudomonadales bacterium]
MPQTPLSENALQTLADQIKIWGKEMGFQALGITDIELGVHEARLQDWLDKGLHGDLGYMAQHGSKRSHPEELIPGTLRVISARLDYLTVEARETDNREDADHARVSRYAMGRDYHKLIRKRLSKLAEKIEAAAQELSGEATIPNQFRAFVDSAPVLERALAEKAGLGWIGKNTMLMSREAGSYFFLGEIYTNLPLPIDQPDDKNNCGKCTACLDVCPTNAFVSPYVLDAKKCVSYLTIELKGSIPEELRAPIGNRIFGCDDCQSSCPWNRFAKPTDELDFQPRHGLNTAQLIDLFNWSEEEFLDRTAGSAIRRSGYEGWLRNIAVALGNAPSSIPVIEALKQRADDSSEVVQEHVKWALKNHSSL